MAEPIVVRPPPREEEKEVLEIKPQQRPRVKEKVVVKEKEKLKQGLTYSPEQSILGSRTYAPSYSYDTAYAPEEFTARTQIYSPSQTTRQRYAPRQVTATRQVYSPSLSSKQRFAPTQITATRQVYAPTQKTRQRYAPFVKQDYVYKPKLFDKLVAIFAPQTIVRQKEDIKYKPYDYQQTETAIIDAYDPEQITEVQKFAPKTDESFSLRIAPEAELSMKINPTPAFITSVDYGLLLKRLIR